MEKDTLATEMLKELKAQSKRWFIIAIIELIIIIATNVGWLIYNAQFETITTDETTQYIEDVDNSNNSTYTQSIN